MHDPLNRHFVKSMFRFFSYYQKIFAEALFERGTSRKTIKDKVFGSFPAKRFYSAPNTNLNASAMLDLPEPFGPTIPEIGAEKSSVVFFANDLKPESSKVLNTYDKFIIFTRFKQIFHLAQYMYNA